MKKSVLNLATSVILLCAGSFSTLYGQDNPVASNTKKAPSYSSSPAAEAADPKGNAMIFLESNLLKKFNKAFPEAKDAVWYRDGNMTRFYFHGDGTIVRSAMNEKGRLLFTIRYYEPDHLPRAVASAIRDAFPGYKMRQVTEVSIDEKIAFIVKVDGMDDWLQVKYLDGDVTILQKFTY
ncbi:hypothetical protein [Flavihumibacter solisilvae]|uniref:Beta-lactamase-inhibitor-like PepSY-like domain-containing protein n=1 Tax=Flavihumibacter solisilvae TaxID=1349421 RepID=A0A0C1L683_9BACT|nr:hypothetical protein [Flavihumibacter solisilvae]KIC95001.1 hypothetical protein OI18_08940 [Flavihumibacter solisilvae]